MRTEEKTELGEPELEGPQKPTMVLIDVDELGILRSENRRLSERVEFLFKAAHHLVEEKRRADRRAMVAHFHHLSGHPVLDAPQAPSVERVRLRLSLVREEFFELCDAMLGTCTVEPWLRNTAEENVKRLIELAPPVVDLVEAADALADLDYVVEGTRLELGIDGAPVFREVHRSNLEKFPLAWVCSSESHGAGVLCKPDVEEGATMPCLHGDGSMHTATALRSGHVDERGKVLKPAGWTPPNIEGELRKQGWRP